MDNYVQAVFIEVGIVHCCVKSKNILDCVPKFSYFALKSDLYFIKTVQYIALIFGQFSQADSVNARVSTGLKST